jgi:hypothetical protein
MANVSLIRLSDSYDKLFNRRSANPPRGAREPLSPVDFKFEI